MKKISCLAILLAFFHAKVTAQNVEIPVDTTVVTSHRVNIKGQRIDYTATTGMQPVWNDEGEPVASLFYTYYKRSGNLNVKNRPLVISFNGGPGSASVW